MFLLQDVLLAQALQALYLPAQQMQSHPPAVVAFLFLFRFHVFFLFLFSSHSISLRTLRFCF
jgi:hypothetical protein